MNGTIACALATQAQSHLISLTGYPKGSDSILAMTVRPEVMRTYLWLLCVLCGHVVKTKHTLQLRPGSDRS